MVSHIEMIPLKGIVINKTLEIAFGQTVEACRMLMEQEGTRVQNKWYWFDNNLCLEFKDNTLVFIQVSNCDEIDTEMFGSNPFAMTDEELIPFLCKNCGTQETGQADIGQSYDYIVESQQISLYRGITPYDISESIEEAKAEGFYDEEMEAEYVKSRFFETIGIGATDYFSE